MSVATTTVTVDPRVARLALLAYLRVDGLGVPVGVDLRLLKAQCRADAASLALELTDPPTEYREAS